MRIALVVLLVFLSPGCSVDMGGAAYFRSGEAIHVVGPRPFFDVKEGASVGSAPKPILPEAKHESALSPENQSLFAPGREPL
jgi:hypothetical protein